MMNAEFKVRHDYFLSELQKMPGIKCLPADGAFYVLFDVSDVIKRLNLPEVTDDHTFAQYLLTTVGLALVPGSAFGAPGYLRASIAASMTHLKEAIKRLRMVVEQT